MNIDIVREAGAKREMDVSFDVARLPRVLEALPESATSEVKAHLSFGVDGDGQAYVDVTVEGTLQVRCQRCLELMPFLLESSNRLSPVKGVDQDLLGDVEPICVDENGGVEVSEMIEEEVLLGLPMCPMHAIEECASEDSPEESEASLGTRKSFAGLAELLNRSKG